MVKNLGGRDLISLQPMEWSKKMTGLLEDLSGLTLAIILFFVSLIAWLGVFFEVQSMKKKRIADLEVYAVNNNYNFSSKPETVEITEFKNFKAITMLATATIGAVYSSCSPDFGLAGAVDRFSQIEPKLLMACDGYLYAGKKIFK